MTSETGKFSLRVSSELLKKFHYVAGYNGRSSNKELEMLMKRHVSRFEEKNGEIIFEEE